ncbi:CUB domain-containing protein 1-like [Stegastes partitus]|uniref:CUB domain-containing protein 1-like n=1 Tax=Stegastes partitus TaxID=144197 RepID=A0A3B5AIA0_9TELE|nr:PREDICTED: CUB domain-containing protein 1-like [Stegastes partitus]
MFLLRPALLILLRVFIVSTSGVPGLRIAPDRGTTIVINNRQGKGCQVCIDWPSEQCNTSLTIQHGSPVSLWFRCAEPQNYLTVDIVRDIECTSKSCSGLINQTDGGFFLRFLNRTFTWNLKASELKAVKLDFANTGLRQINPSERCPDGHTYSLQALQATGSVALGKFCKMGTISSVQILNQGSFSLDLPKGQWLQNGHFAASVGEEIRSLAKISLTLPKGASSSELLTPNYPESFPNDDTMEWYFQVPDKHRVAVQFGNLTEPKCLRKETAVEYSSKGRWTLFLRLTDTQPVQNEGSFSLTLRNCEMDRKRSKRAGSAGLSLNLKVSAAGPPVLCEVDLSKAEGLALHIEKVKPASKCEMEMNSVKKEKITVTSRSKLSFRDCLPDDVQVTAKRVIGCSHLKDCPKTPVRLLVPQLPSCLPASLSSVTWTLRPGQHGTVLLTSPTGPLKQSLPGQPCNGSIFIKLTEDDGTTIGHFCPRGAIQEVKIHTNVSVTWTPSFPGRTLRSYYKHVLNASFEKEIRERYIYTISPSKDAPVLVGTPGWPVGMKSYSTVSWIVNVPPKMDAHLKFANLSQPKCNKGHTSIRVQRIGNLEEDYSRREDEEAESEITVSESFYLNMSSCMPERGEFRVITKITLQKAKNLLLTIILSVVAALLVIFAIVLAAVCVVVRKKKKKLDHQVSIYNPNGTSFLPGHNGFPTTPEDSEAHVYASIEDTLVYTHLLKKGAEIGIYGDFETYRPFAGQTDSQRPLVSKDAGGDNMETGVYRSFQHPSQQGPPLPNRPPSHVQPMVDNEIYQTDDQNEEERSPSLGPRLEPEGGN